MARLLGDVSRVELLTGGGDLTASVQSTVVPQNEFYVEGFTACRELLETLATQQLIAASLTLKQQEQTCFVSAATELSLTRKHSFTFAWFVIDMLAPVPSIEWVEAVVDLFETLTVAVDALEGWAHPTRDGDTGPRSPRFTWVRPLSTDHMPAQVEFYGWLVWVPPSVVDTLGGVTGFEQSGLPVTVRERTTASGTGIVARLGDNPRQLTDEDLRAWRSFLAPAMNESSSFTPGMWHAKRPVGVLPEDW